MSHCQSVNAFLRIVVTRVVLSLCLCGVIANNQVTTLVLSTSHLGSIRHFKKDTESLGVRAFELTPVERDSG